MLVPSIQLPLITLVTFLMASASAQTEEFSLVNAEGYFPPYEMRNGTGKLKGFYIELVEIVSKKVNLTPRYITLPWRRGLHDMGKGKADAMLSVIKTEERQRYLWFLEGNSLTHVVDSLCVLSGHQLVKTYKGNLKQLSSNSIGLVKGYRYADEIEDADFLNKLYLAKDDRQLLKLLLLGRIDAAVVERHVALYMAKEQGVLDQIVCLEPSYDMGKEYIVFSKVRHKKELAEKFSLALSQFKKTQAYRDLAKKYQIRDDLMERD